MEEYIGQACLHCGKVFTAEDDIVSCPECGTPYHRACWKENGRCINDTLHEKGESWISQRKHQIIKERSAEKQAEEFEQAALRERGESPQLINATLYDGARLNPDDPCCGFDPAEDMDGVTMGDVAEFVRDNRFYYLPLFRLMKRTGKRFSFNLICLFFPELYFANRKMWGWALSSMIINLVLYLPMLFKQNSEMGLHVPLDVTAAAFLQWGQISNAARLIFSALCCLFANRLYYRYAVRKIGRIRETAVSEAQYHAEIQEAGGTSLGNILLALIIEAALIFTVLIVTTLMH